MWQSAFCQFVANIRLTVIVPFFGVFLPMTRDFATDVSGAQETCEAIGNGYLTKSAIFVLLVTVLVGSSLVSGSLGHAAVIVSPSSSSLDFGSVQIGSTKQLSTSLTVTVTGGATANKMKLRIAPAKSPFSLRPNTFPVKKLKHNQTANIAVVVTFAPLRPGTFHATLVFDKHHEVAVTGHAALPPFATCDTAKELFFSGSSGSVSKIDNIIFAVADTGETPSQIQAALSTDAGLSWGKAFNVTADTDGNNEDPSADHDLNRNLHVTWQHSDLDGNSSIEYVKLNRNGNSDPILNLGSGRNPHIAVDGLGNPVIVYEHDGIVFQKSDDKGSTFGSPTVIDTDTGAFNPLVTANGSNLFFAWSNFVSSVETESGIFASDDGSTITKPLVLHQGLDSGDLAAFGSLFFLGQIDATVVDVGAHNAATPSDSFAFIDFGNATGNGGFTAQHVGRGFFPASAYSRSDNMVEIAASFRTNTNIETHLLQGQVGGSFTDITANPEAVQQVSISGDDSAAFIVQTINSIPGPIEITKCH
jgi:hypothetical protein